MTSYEIGRLVGLLTIPVVGIVLAIWMRRRENRWWWIPLAVALVAVIGVFARAAGQAEARPEELEPASVLVPVSGYRFPPAPEAIAQDLESQYLGRPEIAEHIRGFELRLIETDGGRRIGGLSVLGVHPDAFLNPSFVADYRTGLASALGGEVRTTTLAGTEAFEVSAGGGAAEGAYVVSWQHENLMVTVAARDRSEATEIAEALIEGTPAEA